MDFMGNVQNTQPRQVEAEQQVQYADPYKDMAALNYANEKQFLDVIKHYTEDDMVPEKVKKSQWSIFGRTLSLTFLEENDLPIIDMFTNILRIDTLTSQPAHRLTFEQTHQMDQTQLFFYIQAKRAIGSNKGKMNERTLQVTQIGQNISTQTMNNAPRPKNVWSKISGMF